MDLRLLQRYNSGERGLGNEVGEIKKNSPMVLATQVTTLERREFFLENLDAFT